VLQNTATASSSTFDTNPANNTATAATTVRQERADLFLTKSDSPDPAFQGQPLTYTIQVTNLGPDRATDTIVTDPLPAQMIFVSATPTQGTCDPPVGQIVICHLGAIPSAGGAVVTIVVIPTQPNQTVHNTACVSSASIDPTPIDPFNCDTEDTTILAAVDLAVAKVASAGTITVGDVITYSISITNLVGSSTATGVVLTDVLPVGFVILMTSAGCATEANLITCTVGTLVAGASAQRQIVVQATNAVVGCTQTNRAFVRSSGNPPDPNQANNSASVTATMTPCADLSVTDPDSPDPAFTGQVVTYVISVHNGGPDAAPNTFLTDTMPAGFTYGGITGATGCTGTFNKVCPLGTIPAGDDATVTITGTVAPGHPLLLVNRVFVRSTAHDPDLRDNYDSEATCAAVDATYCAHTALSGAEEVPPTGSPATGEVRIGMDATDICGSVQVHGLLGTPTAAHIHEAPPGVNGPIIRLDLGPPDPTTGLTTGCATDATLAGQIRTNPAQFYVDVHSTAFPGGEIRGQLIPG
jgi:uncharacterized repeat protein (TIGR01451 family)